MNNSKRRREKKEVIASVTLLSGAPPSVLRQQMVERQRARCALSGCIPNVRTSRDPERPNVEHVYFEHDNWCAHVGGKGQ